MTPRAPLLVCLLLSAAPAFAGTSSADLWDEYRKNPNTHPNIPNCSYAGVFRGEHPLPNAPVVANVRDHGAKGDGTTDDTEAFRLALAQTTEKRGTLLIPAGTYKISSHLVIGDRTVLRGEDAEKTILEFTKPLNDTTGQLQDAGSSAWSWAGGLLWFGPKDTFDQDGKVHRANPMRVQDWEYWRPGETLTSVAGSAGRGDQEIEVEDAAGLKAGQLVLLTWENPADASLLKHIAGHALMEQYNWNSATWILPPQYPEWQWPVEIKSVSGRKVSLAQPLRIDIRPEWHVTFKQSGQYVQFAGVENLTIKLPAPREHKHFRCVGWNGIYFNRAYNCWAKNITIVGAENPVIFSSAKNCSVEGLKVTGEPMNHHSLAMRVNTHDCLVHDFDISGMWRVKHGINIEWLSSGNVYSKGKMTKGTFDSHRALSFDLIRTEISLTNDADGPGGAGQAGPFIGARVVHWNILVDATSRTNNDNAPGDFVFMPETFPLGAFVGIRGAPRSDKVRDSVPGDKGSLIADEDKEPPIKNLWLEQKKLRLGK